MDIPPTHTTTLGRSAITIGELVVDASVQVSLEDTRSEATQLFSDLSPPQQRQLATEAWQIGLRALGNAQAQARESKLEDIGKTLLGDVDTVLKRHVSTQLSAVEAAMNHYFDPQEGQGHLGRAQRGVARPRSRGREPALGPRNVVHRRAPAVATTTGSHTHQFSSPGPAISAEFEEEFQWQFRSP